MTIHALVPQCAHSVLNFSECKIANIFWYFSPGPYWWGLKAPPDSQLYNGFCSHSLAPLPKIAGYDTVFRFYLRSLFDCCYYGIMNSTGTSFKLLYWRHALSFSGFTFKVINKNEELKILLSHFRWGTFFLFECRF